jgi:hypothetical protein
MGVGGAVHADAEALYREFVAAELHSLLRTAYLLCGSWHTAEDLVQATFVALYRAWSRLETWTDPPLLRLGREPGKLAGQYWYIRQLRWIERGITFTVASGPGRSPALLLPDDELLRVAGGIGW